MIGDNKLSDFVIPRKLQFESIRYFPFFHKIKTNLLKNKKIDDIYMINSQYNHLFHYTNYVEYAYNIYFSMYKLKKILRGQTVNIAFLSRGGYFLKKVFDLLQSYGNEKHRTVYLKNSRKVNYKANNNDESAELMKKYFEDNGICNPMYIVDEGWYCSSQISFSKLYGWETYGYYIGIMGKPEAPLNCYRNGLLFDIDQSGKQSPFYGIFRSNCTLYEQILTAPHGSLIEYKLSDNGMVVSIEDDVPKEQELYNKSTKYLQNQMLHIIENLNNLNIEYNLYWLAKKNLKTLLFASKSRLDFLRLYNEHYYNNFTNNQKKGISAYSISVLDIVIHPLNYVRFFCKVKEVKSNSRIMRIFYKPIGALIYVICKISLWKENRRSKGENFS